VAEVVVEELCGVDLHGDFMRAVAAGTCPPPELGSSGSDDRASFVAS